MFAQLIEEVRALTEELPSSSPSHPENRRLRDQEKRAAAKKEIMHRWHQLGKVKPAIDVARRT